METLRKKSVDFPVSPVRYYSQSKKEVQESES